MESIIRIVDFEVRDLAEAWTRGLWHFFNYARPILVDEGSFKGHYRLQLDLMIIHVIFPDSGSMIPNVPPGVPVPTDYPGAADYTVQLMEESSFDRKNLVYGYGDYVHNQMNWVIKHFRETGFGNNHCHIVVGDPQCYLAYEEGEEGKRHSPCLRGLDCKIIDGALHIGFYFRSWDFYSGFPSNIFAVEMMKQYMADEIGVKNGELIAMSMGAHLYDFCWESVAGVLKQKLPPVLREILERIRKEMEEEPQEKIKKGENI